MEVKTTTRGGRLQPGRTAEQWVAPPVLVLFRGERRLWREMSEAERRAYVAECRRLRAQAEGQQ